MSASGLGKQQFVSPHVLAPRCQLGCPRPRGARFVSKVCRKRHAVALRWLRVQASLAIMHELPSKSLTSPQSTVKHLIIMANGLYGNASNWDVVIENLRTVLDTTETLLAASDANSLTQTFDGIDSCGGRLAAEIELKAKENPSLCKISFIGHSMGGLLVRYAAGKLYDPSSKLICGLRPAHFITLATPHMGCDGQGPAQVPFIGWTGDVPLAGSSIQRLLQSAAKPFVAAFMKRTGRQFFMHDTEEGQVPLLVRMTEDIPGEGFFISALDSFVTRTCYGNAGGDHLVGWANSSIRHPDELPDIDAAMQRKGVIKEDALQAALHPQAAAAFLRHHALDRSSPDSAVDHGKEEKRALEQKDSSDANTSTAAVKQAGNLEEPASSQSGAHQLQSDGAVHESNTIHGSKQEGQQVAAEQIVESSQNALLILTRLQTLPWRRIDVSFEGTRMPFFAHNHIQVTRKWLNWYGNAVCQHLAQQIADMEKHKSIQNLIG